MLGNSTHECIVETGLGINVLAVGGWSGVMSETKEQREAREEREYFLNQINAQKDIHGWIGVAMNILVFGGLLYFLLIGKI